MPPRPTSAQPGTAARRIKKEIADLSKEDLGSMTLAPNESNIFQWKATLPGPAGSPYEGGVFEVEIKVPDDYPFSPPHLHFVTKVYHCNIASSGAICLDLLKHAWSPALSLYKVILSLSSLLTDPNPADPLVPAIAQEYRKSRKQHDATAREWVKKYAMPKTQSKTKPAPAAAAAGTSSTRASTSRPRAVARPTPTPAAAASSTNGTPAVPQIAGTRRSASARDSEPIDLASESDEDRTRAGGSRRAAAAAPANGERRNKRSRVNGTSGQTQGAAGGSAGDAIVIDE